LTIMDRVVVTGIGAVTPLGNTFGTSWDVVKSGTSGLSPITKFDPSGLPWNVAGQLKDFEAALFLSQKEIRRLDPFVHYAVAASLMAAEDAGLIGKSEYRNQGGEVKIGETLTFNDKDYLKSGGVIIGSSRGGISSIERILSQNSCILGHSGRRRLSPYIMPSTTISMAPSYVAQRIGLKGYCLGISNACSSGANAIGEAFRLLRTGYRGPVLAGGTEAPVCRLCIEGYGISGALSRVTDSSASRPFDKKRDGFVLSEGACILVLENYTEALNRRAHIYGEIMGYGNATDAFHQTRPDPQGEARTIMLALHDASVNSEMVEYINTHGTGTPLGDTAEAQALNIVFGKRAAEIPVSALKSMSGHMLAASGSFEVASTLLTMQEGAIPPTINLDERDSACNVNVVTERKKKDVNISMSSSFGFGGINVVLILKSYNDFS
jgi:3-oxoacyl-[acyl-carrier-protein] synthase II